MTAPLAEPRASAVVAAAGCKLVEGRANEWHAVDRGMTVRAWGKAPADVATMLRERAAGDVDWRRRALDRAQREFGEAIAAYRAIEVAAGAPVATIDHLEPASLPPDVARDAVLATFLHALDKLRASDVFDLGPDQALAFLAGEMPCVDWAQLPDRGLANGCRIVELVVRAVSKPATADDTPRPPTVAPRDLPAVLASLDPDGRVPL